MLSQTIKEPHNPSFAVLHFFGLGMFFFLFFFPEHCGFGCWNVTVRLLCSTAHSFEVTSAVSPEPHTAPNDLDGLNEIKHRFFFPQHRTAFKRSVCNRLLYRSNLGKKNPTQATLNIRSVYVQVKNAKMLAFFPSGPFEC